MRTNKKTPKTITHINENILFLSKLQKEMNEHLMAVANAYRNMPELRQKAYDEGMPGDTQEFYGPLFDLKAAAGSLVTLASHIKAFADVLLAKPPEEWEAADIFKK